jgi:SPP1 family predicted phage head-tail adaptor
MVACKCGEDFGSNANNRIIVQTKTLVADNAGGWVESWADALTLWAVIEPMSGREMFISSQLQSRVDARITIRYQSSLADTTEGSKFRVKFGTRIYNVKAVKNLADDMKTEGKRYQQLLCTEGEPS